MNYYISTILRKFYQIFPMWLRIELKYFKALCFKDSNIKEKPVFVLGSYRSGTTMLLYTLERCSECCVYHEPDKLAAKNYRIRSDKRIRRLIKINEKELTIFKPLNDVQYADRFLNVHPNVRVIWIYRNYRDVVNSLVVKWGETQKKIMLGITKGSYSIQGVTDVGERMKPETLTLLKTLCREDMSSEDGAALVWYVRNLIYFELKLYKDYRVLLVKYEDLVADPIRHLKRIYNHIYCPFHKEDVKDIHASSVKKAENPIIDSKIELLCEEMMVKLNEQYDLQLGNHYQ